MPHDKPIHRMKSDDSRRSVVSTRLGSRGLKPTALCRCAVACVRVVSLSLFAVVMLAPATSRAESNEPASSVAQRKLPNARVSPDQPGPATQPSESPTELLIVQALDQATDLQLHDVPIREAIRQLSTNTGIPIEIAEGTLSRLPYGPKTTLSATIEDQPLRDSLRAVLRPLGLKFEPTGDRVTIEPTPPLARMTRRATWDELATLQKLYSDPWSKKLAQSLAFQFQVVGNREVLCDLAEEVGTGSAARVLEHACNQRGWTWTPLEQHIAIRSQTQQIELQLGKRISCRYTRASLKDVLLDLAKRASVLLHFDPGVLVSVSPQTHFSIKSDNYTIRQVMEVIAGETGLNYIIESDGVRIAANPLATAGPAGQVDATAQATVKAFRSNAIVGQITLEGDDKMSFSFFVREMDLPSDVNERRKNMIRRAADQIGKTLREIELED